MNFKKLLWYAVVVFIVWFIITQPTSAAGTFHAIVGALENAASSVGTFVSGVTG